MPAPRLHRSTRRPARLLGACAAVSVLACSVAVGVAGAASAGVTAAADQPTFGPTTLLLQGSTVTSTFTVESSTPVTLGRVQTALRADGAPVSEDGRLDFGAFTSVTVAGASTFSASAALPPGDYSLRPTYQLNGTWVDSEDTVHFTIGGAPATAPLTNPPAAPAPAPTAAPAPTTSPAPTAVPAPTAPSAPAPAQSTSGLVGSASGFSPGGAFPWLGDAELARDLDAMKATGATWVRVDFSWSATEPSPGTYKWANLDRVTAAVAARGMKVLALPAYSPAWARPAACSTNKCPPLNPDDFANFVAAAARHFGPDRVQAWELWNEPNIPSFWSPSPDADAYSALLKSSAAALRAVRPHAYIVSGGLSPAYSDGKRIAPVDFVKRMYELGAMKDVDALGMHPYSADVLPLTPGTESWNTFLQMKTAYDVMTAYGDGGKQVWATEFGVATGTSEKSTSEAQQAAIIAQGFSRLSDGSWPWLGTLFAYSLRDHADDIHDWQSNFGLTRNDGSAKPAYIAFTESMRLPLAR